ncbi:MAG: IS1595 family transposase [Bacteroidales bacterium]|jgi:transposase-like protein
MKQKTFQKFLSAIDSFNSRQTRQLEEKLKELKAKDKAALLLETPIEKLTCPHCGSSEIWRWGKRDKLQRYRCKNCRKTFNSLTGTPLAKLNKKEQWLNFTNCLTAGMTVRKSAAKCNIHKNTAFHWRHRFLSAAQGIKPAELAGIIESRETYIRRSEKGNKHLERSPRKRGGRRIKLPKKDLVCLVVARDRYKSTYDTVLEKLTTQELKKKMCLLSKDALFCSEKKWVYQNFTKAQHLRHGTLQLKAGEFTKKDIVHLSNVTNYQNRLRNWLLRFHGVSTKYLNNYLSWYRELDEFDLSMPEEILLLRAKAGGTYKVQPKFAT